MHERSPGLLQKNTGGKGIFPCHLKTGSGRPGPCVKGGFAAYPPAMGGGGFGPAGKKAMGGLGGNPLPLPCTTSLYPENPILQVDVTPPGIPRYGNTFFLLISVYGYSRSIAIFPDETFIIPDKDTTIQNDRIIKNSKSTGTWREGEGPYSAGAQHS